MLRRGGIERGARREMLSRPLPFIPVTAEYPLPGRRLRGALAHQFGHFCFACTLRGVDIVGTVGFCKKVEMRVDEAWQHGLAVQIDHLRVPVTRATHFVLTADRHNAPAASVDSNGLRAWLRGVHGVDCAVDKEVDGHRFLLWLQILRLTIQ